MKGKIFTILISTISVFILLFFYISSFLFYKCNRSDIININKLLTFKEGYANSIDNRKIVITSGSNSMYGINSKLIENTFSVPSVNLGVSADLALDYIIYNIKKVLKNGDIVVLPLEYRVFNFEKSNKYKLQKQYTFAYDKNFFIKKYGYVELLDYSTHIKVLDLLKSISLEKKYDNKKYIGNVINRNGDILNNKKKLKIMWDNPRAISQLDYEESDGLRLLKSFKVYCQEKDIALFISFPNTIRYKEYEKNIYKKYFENLYHVLLKNEFDILGKPSDFMFDRKYFFNSAYHMNKEGVAKRTHELIKLLKNNDIFMNLIKK